MRLRMLYGLTWVGLSVALYAMGSVTKFHDAPIIPPPINQEIQIRQAVTDQRLSQDEIRLQTIEEYIATSRERTELLQEEIATLRGIGIGFGTLLGFFQALQVILQIKQANGKGGLR